MASSVNRVTEAEKEQLRQGHAAGKTLFAICREMGRTCRTMDRHVEAMGLVFVHRYRQTKQSDLLRIQQGHARGETLRHIARELSMSIANIQVYASRLGLNFRPGRPAIAIPSRTKEQGEAERRVIVRVAPTYGIRSTARAMGLAPTQVRRTMKLAGLKSPLGCSHLPPDPNQVAAAVGRAWMEIVRGQAA